MCGCWSRAATSISGANRSGPMVGGQLRPQHLHRDLAVVLEVLGEVDRGHAPLAQLPLEAVAVGEGGDEWSGGRAHRFAESTAAFIRATHPGTTRR